MSEDHMPNRRSLTTWRAPIIAIATAASLAALAADESSPAGNGGRTIAAESRFDVTNPAQQVQLVQLVVDFPPGAWTSWHTHGGQAINLVLEGEMTLRHAGMEQGYRAGQAWTDSLDPGSRCRQHRGRQGSPAHELFVAAGRAGYDRGAGVSVRADDRIRGEIRSPDATSRCADRAAGGRSRSRLARRTRARRLHREHRLGG